MLFDEMEVVEKPFGGRGDSAAALDAVGDDLVGFPEDAFVFLEAGKKAIMAAPSGLARGDDMIGGDGGGMPLELSDAEHFGAKRLFVGRFLAIAVANGGGFERAKAIVYGGDQTITLCGFHCKCRLRAAGVDRQRETPWTRQQVCIRMPAWHLKRNECSVVYAKFGRQVFDG